MIWRVILLFTIIVWFFALLLRGREVSVRLLISMMFFAGVGYAVGDSISDGWSIYGALLGMLVGIEIKERFFQLLQMIYQDFTEER